ncbi:MAG: amidohydrolase family protein, partial [Candidatus Bilamarchaeaceae archaeon]
LGYGMMDKSEGREAEEELRKAKRTLRELGRANPRIKASISAHSAYMCSEELVVKAKELANEEGLLFQMHVSETREEVFNILSEKKMRPVQYLESLGVVDSLSLFSHMGWVTKKEIEIAGKGGANVAHCPVSSLKLGVGDIAPISEFMENGANVCLGTDGPASNNSLNMLESMKMGLLLQSHKYWDPSRFTVGQAWDCATLNGAKALGIHAGEISPGKLADLAIADAKAANLKPLPADLRLIAYSISPLNITDVIIDGKFVMREGHIEFVDEELVAEKAEDVAKEIMER